jgi:hypothetical protein
LGPYRLAVLDGMMLLSILTDMGKIHRTAFLRFFLRANLRLKALVFILFPDYDEGKFENRLSSKCFCSKSTIYPDKKNRPVGTVFFLDRNCDLAE